MEQKVIHIPKIPSFLQLYDMYRKGGMDQQMLTTLIEISEATLKRELFLSYNLFLRLEWEYQEDIARLILIINPSEELIEELLSYEPNRDTLVRNMETMWIYFLCDIRERENTFHLTTFDASK